MKGRFITLYGINNIGKSTHARRLVERLRSAGRKVEYVKYPVYDLEPTGPFLDRQLRGGQTVSEEELQKAFVRNRVDFEPQIREWLSEGVTVVAEDYIGTGIAWGVAKGLDEAWLEDLNKDLLKEDLAILMEGKRDTTAVEAGHVHENDLALIAKCQEEFSKLADKYGWKRVQVQENWDETEGLVWEAVNSSE